MSYYRRRRPSKKRDGMSIKIRGEKFDLFTARIVFKCAECFGDLELKDAGLRCKVDHAHRRYIHRDEVAKVHQQQREQMAEVEATYEIIDGKIVYKELTDAY